MSKVIKATVLAVMLLGLPHLGMSAGNADNSMGSLEDFRSKTALAEAQIDYLEKLQKLTDLQSGKTTRSEFKPMATSPMNMPPMNMSPRNMSPVNTQQKVGSIGGGHDEVLGVMGVEGKYTATIKTASGIYKVRKGDKMSIGVISLISLDKVVLKKEGKSISLPFAE